MIGYSPAVGGGWSRYFVAHRGQLHRADPLPDEVAVLTDRFASALRPVLPASAGRGRRRILVIGAGTIGVLTVKALRLTGWKGTIAVSGRYPFQLELAEAAGADLVFRSRDEAYGWAASLPDARAYKPTLAPRSGGRPLARLRHRGQGWLGRRLAGPHT